MTFDPTPVQQSRVAAARQVAAAAAPEIADSDQSCVVPSTVLSAVADAKLDDPFSPDAVSAVLVVEEFAVTSAALATVIGLGRLSKPAAASTPGWPGLRGAERALKGVEHLTGVAADGARLVLCAVAVGVARAAIEHAIATLKESGLRPGGDEQTPHWTLADAAAEVDAARLLTLAAAQKLDQESGATVSIAIARSFTATAAERAVEAAIRVLGPSSYQAGTLLERLSRDARTLTLVPETVEQSRTTASAILRS